MLAAALLTCACSRGDTTGDVPPLPDQTAETANALMAEAERAAGNAATRAETSTAPARSNNNPVEEETP
jgi:hypothetical protein